MKLNNLTEKINTATVSGDKSVEISGVTADSRNVEPGMVYVAIKGTETDGADFIPQAIEAGAVVVVSQNAPSGDLASVSWVRVNDAREALGVIATELAGSPSKEFKIAGVTGTNGKTTTTYMMHHLLMTAHTRAGLMGTVKVHNGVEEVETCHTTPDPVTLQKQLREMADNGCRSVAMEVSSHGIEQKRVDGIEFDVVAFTNLTQDHLDYHGNMETYFAVKRQLFVDAAERNDKKVKAVINLDDAYGAKLVKEFAEKMSVVTYGMGVHCDYRFGKIKQSVRGSEFELQAKGKSYLVRLPMIGRFNIYNAVAAIASCVSMGVSMRAAIKSINDMPKVPGRLEHAGSSMGVNIFVDYAHTPDALKNVCATLNELDPKRLITVFGCGGDRDKTKRPLMAKAAGEESDLCFITSDNPRSEDPESILKEIEVGMVGCPSRSIIDREEAIKTAVAIATGGDIVLIAGKGHEDYQIFAEETIKFDDRIKARAALREFKVTNLQKDREEGGRDGDRSMGRDERRNDRPRRDDGERREFKPRREDGDRPRRDDGDRGGYQGRRDGDRDQRPRRDDGERREFRPRREDGDRPRRNDSNRDNKND